MIKYKIKKEISLTIDDDVSKTHTFEDSGSINISVKGEKHREAVVSNYKDYKYHVLNDIAQKEDSCIVVGGSPNILDYEYGDEIDSFDKVIRCNSCPVEGIEKHVGSKTNIWSTSLTAYKCFVKERWSNFYFPDQLLDNEIWFRTEHTMLNYKQIAEAWFDTEIKCRILKWKYPTRYGMTEAAEKDEFSQKIKKLVGKSFLTTGVYTIVGALQLYKKVTIAGFTFYTENDAKRNHTYSGIILNENLRRHAEKQKNLLFPFVEEERVKFLIPEEKEIFDGI